MYEPLGMMNSRSRMSSCCKSFDFVSLEEVELALVAFEGFSLFRFSKIDGVDCTDLDSGTASKCDAAFLA